MTKFNTLSALALIGAIALGSTAASACEGSFVGYEEDGRLNLFDVDSDGYDNQINGIQQGVYNLIENKVTGDCNVVVTYQDGFGNVSKSVVLGNYNQLGVVMRGNATVETEIRGDNTRGAVYADRGDVRISSNGDDSRFIVKTR